MNILRKIVKETVLVPWRVVEGVVDALDHVIDPEKEAEAKKEK